MPYAARSRVYAARPAAPLSPWLAVNLSAVFPGLGQLYGGAVVKGVALGLGAVAIALLIIHAIFAREGNTLFGLYLLLPLFGLYGFSLWDSYQTLRRQAEPRPIHQDPWYPVLLSQILPGLGQLYRQQALLGGLFLVMGVGIAFQANFHPALLPLPPLIWALSCAHAYRQGNPQPHQVRWLAAFLVALIGLRLVVGYIPVGVRQLVEQCIVPSESMLPTLQVNDRIFVAKQTSYQPQTQDIVVFTAPPEAVEQLSLQPNDLLVKRVIGLPGQQIAIQNRQVWVDGRPLAETYVTAPASYEWPEQTVPPGNLFVLGDNRNFSADSHVWGFLPQANIIGRAYKIYWPPQRVQPLE